MPLLLALTDPFSVSSIDSAWAYCSVLTLNFASKTGRIVYDIHANKTAAYSGGLPIKQVEYAITPEGSPAVYGDKPLISAYVPAVTHTVTIRAPGTNGPDDPGEFQTVVDSPAVDPVYGDAPLLRAAFPGFDALVSANSTAYGLLLTAVDTLARTQPEFESATVDTA